MAINIEQIIRQLYEDYGRSEEYVSVFTGQPVSYVRMVIHDKKLERKALSVSTDGEGNLALPSLEDQLKSVELEKQIVLEPYYAAAEFKAIAVINDTLDIMRSYAEDEDLRANLPLMTNKIGELTKALRGLTANSVSSSIGDKNSGSQINVQIVNEIV